MKLKIIAALLLMFIIAVCGIAAGWYFNFVRSAQAHNKAGQYIQIARGSSPAGVAEKLQAEGIISNATLMQIYLRISGEGANLKAGDYQFPSPITPLQVIEELKKGEERTGKITILEGWTRFDIAKALVDKLPEKPAETEEEVLAMMDDVSLIKDFDSQAKNLEGYMYPSTYSLPRDTTPKQAIKVMVDQFKKIWKPEWDAQARSLGRTPRDIVIIASLIEVESKKDDERPVVASVIYNRINKSMLLGIDATNIYIAKMLGKWDGTIHKSDLEVDSPYNTRKVAGIPPGPISSPSETALKAALNPAKSDYIFYVLDPNRNDGSHNFYNNAADFERGKAVYQKWLEEQRVIKRQQEAANSTNNN